MKRTEKYRKLLEKQRKEFQDKFDMIFMSMEMILDNVDQEYEQRKIGLQKNNEKQTKI